MFHLFYPVKGVITSRFGWRFLPRKGWHSGLDFACKKGTQILASYRGKVIHVGDWGDYGSVVNVQHNTIGGVFTLYAHLSKICCKVGQMVEIGDKIGEAGSTGYSTGNHLHFEVRIGKNKISYADDPEKYLIVKLAPAIMQVKYQRKKLFLIG